MVDLVLGLVDEFENFQEVFKGGFVILPQGFGMTEDDHPAFAGRVGQP